MSQKQTNTFVQSVQGKIIIASIVACIALYLAWETSKIAFSEILTTVENISEPAERLRLVNNLSLKIVSLEQLQKSLSLNQQANNHELLRELKELGLIIDTLSNLYQGDTLQLQRIASLKVLLKERDRLFANYLKERQGFLNSESMAQQLKSLNDLLEENTRKTDSAIIESEKRTLTTTIYELEEKKQPEQPRGFFSKLFGKKKSEEPARPGYNIINEELNVKFDTVALARQDSILRDLGETMRSIEKTQKIKSERLLNRETLLVYTSDLLIKRMLSVLRQVENEAVKQIEHRNIEAKNVVNNGIDRITVIILVFVLITVILLYLILNDISKNNQYRQQLEIARDEAEYHGRAKQRFLSSMSHEIRTPLQSIIGYSEIIKKQDKPDKKYVDAIFHSSEHLMQIVNEILDYNRIVSGKFIFSPVVFNMEKLLDEVISVMKLQAGKKGIKLYSDYDYEDISFVEGDAFRLKQILYNLLGNAIKFTVKGHVSLTVSCKKQGDNLHFMFIVEDTGVGMTEEETKRVFNEFERSDTAEKQLLNKEGAGLGLSIARSLVEQQGGRISLKSKLGEGSCFTVYLKYKNADSSDVRLADKKLIPENQFNGKVWLVDDDAFIVDLCSFILSNNNIGHTCFYSPEELLQTKWDDDVKFIFTDIRMPGMSGTELCARLRKFVPDSVKIYALTAQVLPEEKEKILNSGFDGLLIKPFREQELLAVLGYSQPQKTNAEELDFTALEKMTFGDKAQLQKILRQFVEDCRQDKTELQESIDREDIKQTALISHRLAGRTAQFGAKSLAEKFRKLELELNEAEILTKETKAILFDLIQKLDNLVEQVENK